MNAASTHGSWRSLWLVPIALFGLASLLGSGGGGGAGGAAPDTTAPTVSATSPIDLSETVAPDSAITVTFSEPMDPASLTTSFTVVAGSAPVAGNVTASGATATFTPNANLAANTTYVATITTGARDVAGNPLAAERRWSFTTGRWNRVFVTSVRGNANLSTWADASGQTGLAAADAVCAARATAAGLSGTYRAWLSDANDDAYCRMHNLSGKRSANCGQAFLPSSAGPWLRMDRFPFAPTIDALTTGDGTVYAPALFTELGDALPAGAHSAYFTATTVDGSLHPSYPVPCANWTSAAEASAGLGVHDATTVMWTSYFSASCADERPLLCMQCGAGPALPAFASGGKKAFITSTKGNGNLATWPGASGQTGLAAADAICQARAAAGGFTGNFKAWLSSATVRARDRITSDGPWVRPDGVLVASSKADLVDGTLFSAISQNEYGEYWGNYGIWSAPADGEVQANSCNDWTDGSASYNGNVGVAGNTNSAWATSGIASPCNATNRYLYCLED